MLHLGIGGLAFAQPWLLLLLAGLPVLWWLLRVTPPTPRTQWFPAIRLLLGLKPPEETPARTPWWLVLLRLLIAALIVLGLAQPLLNPRTGLTGGGPLVLVIDNGWASARNWENRQSTLDDLLAEAEREDRSVIVLPTAPGPRGEPLASSGLLTAAEARPVAMSIAPRPWPKDRAAAQAALEDMQLPDPANVVWLSDGLEGENAAEFAVRLQELGSLRVLRDAPGGLPRLVAAPETAGVGLMLRARRAATGFEDSAVLIATAEDGRPLARTPVRFATDEQVAEAILELPVELRNQIAQLTIEGEASAGAVMLLDERWRRRPVGLVAEGALEEAQPLLSELYYLGRALEPFTELRQGNLDELFQRDLAVLVLPDSIAALDDSQSRRIGEWVEGGGLLVRFAGPRLAAETDEELLPIRLRRGDRMLGGAMTWDHPARLAPFDASSPFAELRVPNDVLIERQVLAEPSLDLGERTWARLTDGTPLVSAVQRGEGWLVLIHTTANTDWSNLPLSGLFVEMLRRIVRFSQGVTGDNTSERMLPPLETLDGFGRLGPAPPTVLGMDRAALDGGMVGPRHPPGFYGDQDSRRALNLAPTVDRFAAMGTLPPGVTVEQYDASMEFDLKPWLLAAGLALALLDLVISLALRGILRLAPRGAAVGLVLLFVLEAPPSSAQPTDDTFALRASLETHLAYVRTGVPAVDEMSNAGLMGLSRVLNRRTSVETAEPMAIDLNRDELVFFPLIYWPITPQQQDLDPEAARRVNDYMQHGGTILFDLREASIGGNVFSQVSPAVQALRRFTRNIDVPPLAPVPPDHVITKSFYLMNEFPGGYSGGTLWVEVTEGRVNDGVASVIIGGNDWARAWAVTDNGQPMFPVIPGGERQREMAYRFGVNLMMYVLTGNYKADQVHVPFILERLGQ